MRDDDGNVDDAAVTGRTSISRSIRDAIDRSSWVRRMFEEGNRLKRELGPENVCDFSLGNPSVPPPPAFHDALIRTIRESGPEAHRYMPNVGLAETRRHLASDIARRHSVGVEARHVVMSCGAAGALNVIFKCILDPGDEVILLRPYFPEYEFYVENHGGRPVFVETTGEFHPDPTSIAEAMTPRTRAVVINTPNNPTGVCYTQEDVDAVARVVENAPGPCLLLLDEPYRRIRYSDAPHPSVLAASPLGVVVSSYSKDLGLAGERIGYLAVHPQMPAVDDFLSAASIATRILGFVNAPALMQRVLPSCKDLSVDVQQYRANRDRLANGLAGLGFDMPNPEGAFFIFPRVPGGDDVSFCDHLRRFNVLCVPGSGFGTAGYMRVSYAVPADVIERALPLFEEALQTYEA